MKIKIDINCTPDEARSFFGLPDIKPLQEKMMQEMEDKLMSNIQSMDSGAVMDMWTQFGTKTFQKLQESFWAEAMKTSTKDKETS